MATPTFTPFRAPDQGTNDKPEFKLRKATFGDGYTQAVPDGLNAVRRVLSLTWGGLTPAQAATIVNFIILQRGATAFWYTPSDEATPVLWTCEDYGDTRGQGGLREIKATFRQSFNPTT